MIEETVYSEGMGSCMMSTTFESNNLQCQLRLHHTKPRLVCRQRKRMKNKPQTSIKCGRGHLDEVLPLRISVAF